VDFVVVRTKINKKRSSFFLLCFWALDGVDQFSVDKMGNETDNKVFSEKQSIRGFEFSF
jgi:hypothetical protein